MRNCIIQITKWTCTFVASLCFIGAAGVAKAGDVYLSPIAVAAASDGSTLYIAEFTAGRVAVLDVASNTITHNIPLAAPNQASSLVLSPDGTKLYVTAADPDGQVYVISTATNTVVDTLPAGHTPTAAAVSPDGRTLYICNRFDNTVSIIDVATKAESIVAVTREPMDAAITPNGQYLVVTNFLPNDAAIGQKTSAVVSIIDTASRTVVATIRLPNGSVSARGVCVSPDGQYAYLVHLLGKFNAPPNQIERGWTFTNMLSIIDISSQTLLNSVILDDLDQGAANPWDVACTADGSYLCVTHAGSHELSVIDRAELHNQIQGVSVEQAAKDFSLLVLIRRRINLTGTGPRGLAVIGTTAYAAEYFTGSLGVVDIDHNNAWPKAVSISLGTELALTAARLGERVFNDGSLSLQNWLSCVSCHPEGHSDALNWDQLNDGFGNPKQSKSLLYSHVTPPTTITGCRPNAETSVRAGLKYAYFTTLPESDAVAVDEYLKSLQPVPSFYLVNGQLSAAAQRGKILFEGSAGCIACHPAPLFTDLNQYDVGTGTGREAGAAFDTPTLVEVWRTAPYLYQGQAATMESVLTIYNPHDQHGFTSGLNSEQISDLTEYVLSI